MPDIVFPEELSYFVSSLRAFELHEVGSSKWMDCHEMVIKLGQQAALEAAEHREESVKEFLVLKDKLRVLVHEAFCILIWKTKILPHLLDIDPNPKASFLIYTVLFHEGAVISLLEISLFHESGCESLQDAAIDVVDYCAQAVAQLIGLVSMGYHENETDVDVDESILTEMDRQKRDLLFKTGLRCISILNYLAEHASVLPLSATRRMVVEHDVPWLMADLLHFRPWLRRIKKGMQKFTDGQWTTVTGEFVSKIVRHEAQTWFCLRQLLFNKSIMQSYEMNDHQRQHLAKLEGLLHETILDQLPPLVELKQYLCQLNISSSGGGDFGAKKKTKLILEEVPQIKQNILNRALENGGFYEISQKQEKIFLTVDKESIFQMAQRLSSAYNTDMLAEIEEKMKVDSGSFTQSQSNLCGNCANTAEKKCSKCKAAFYCSRECQLADWPKHKSTCTTAAPLES